MPAGEPPLLQLVPPPAPEAKRAKKAKTQNPTKEPKAKQPPKRPDDQAEAWAFDRRHWAIAVYAAAKAAWLESGHTTPFPSLAGQAMGRIGHSLEALGGGDLRVGAQKLLAAFDVAEQNFADTRDSYWLPTVLNVVQQDKLAKLLANVRSDSLDQDFPIHRDPLEFETFAWETAKRLEADRIAGLAPQRPEPADDREAAIRIEVEAQQAEFTRQHALRVRAIDNRGGLTF